MKLQKATLFALFAVLELARDPSRQLSAAEIAERYGISANHLAKVLRDLGRAGLVEAVRGAGGGYRFSGNAKRTSLYDVINLFGDIASDAGEIDGSAGSTDVGRALASVLREVDEIAIATFKSISLATVIKALRPQPAGPPRSRKPSTVQFEPPYIRVIPGAVAPPREMLRAYVEAYGDELLAYIGGRPIVLVRPEGDEIGYHHGCLRRWLPDTVKKVPIRKSEGDASERIVVNSVAELLVLVDAGALEFHAMTISEDDLAHPDLMIFNLAPGSKLKSDDAIRAALDLRTFLSRAKRKSWAKTSGEKGFHVMVPLDRSMSQAEATQLSKNLATKFAASDRNLYTLNSQGEEREDKILVDFHRNDKNATVIAAFSPLARPGFAVSYPVQWTEIKRGNVKPDGYTMESLIAQKRRGR